MQFLRHNFATIIPEAEVMIIVPGIPLPITEVEDNMGVKALAGVKSAKRVQQRTLPPLVVQRRHEETPDRTQRHDPHINGERRTYCRRFEHLPVLMELRSAIERRRHKQREVDATEHIDEEV